ncbi:AraC family transcriptional regulator [Virgibacillus siamensis]|uniref:AraC family transcriptional regulator n=1 Tax=Virgibacillus siamensis TaxID=480071 RepID=UPI003D161197
MESIEIDHNLKELTQHRTVVLPIACYETRVNQNVLGYIPLHWHDELQFVFIKKGEATFQLNGENVVVREGDGLFINSGILHMAEERNQSDCTYICLNVSPHFVLSQELYTRYVAPYIQATNLSCFHVDANVSWGKSVLDAIEQINQSIQQKAPYYEMDITIQLTVIWKNIIMNGFPLKYDQTAMLKGQRLKQMINWIHLHYSEKIMLDDIARAGQLSRSECCRYFKRILKTTPLSYVMDYRIQKSLSLLQQADSNVTEVAYQVGFNSTSYFIERFRNMMNRTPLAYKKLKMDEGY